MKTLIAIGALALLAWLGWNFARPGGASPTSAATPGAARIDDLPDTVIQDAAEVFRKAFWKHPAAADHILHAERREWSDEEGVEKWQWFLVVEPSPELVAYLRDENAFSLSLASATAPVANPPDWFRFDSDTSDVLESSAGDMQLVFGKDGGLLHATGSGSGFAKAAR